MSRDSRWGDEPFVICHWDTFDNSTTKVGASDTFEEAIRKVKKIWGGKISKKGADHVDIIDRNGDVVRRFNIG